MTSSARWYTKGWAVALLVLLVLSCIGLWTVKALGVRSIRVAATPFAQPAEGFDYGWWNAALGRWVREGRVDYDAVRTEHDDLRRFVATLAVIGPRSTPERFPTEAERLSYYLNAYNALVLFAVVESWPIESVHDVRGWLDPRPGFGFFYGLRLPLDGGITNLYDLEHAVLRRFDDARIHAAINCASKSCPALASSAFEAGKLESQLDARTRQLCSADTYVDIDEEQREVRLSAIFDWYRDDFIAHAERLGRPATLLSFVSAFAAPEVTARLETAKREGFRVVFKPYDWSLNQL